MLHGCTDGAREGAQETAFWSSVAAKTDLERADAADAHQP